MNTKNHIKPFILSGGSGKRLWPLSRSLYPKQFVNIKSKNSYYQDTLYRLNDPLYLKPNVICNIDHRFMVKDQANQIKISINQIFLEPISKNTAATAIIAALSSKKDDLILLLPSDHKIENKKKFNENIKKGISEAKKGNIILYGVKPTRPETEYGYISLRRSEDNKSHSIVKFIEKPNLNKAKKLMESNLVFWNSGIFLFKAETLLKEASKYCPEILSNVKKSLLSNISDVDFNYLNDKSFKKIKSISIDYAIIQKSHNLKMNKLVSGWSDMGTWNNFWLNSKKDKNNNYIQGDNYSEYCENSLIISDKQFTLTSGLKNFIVVSISNALLVLPKNKLKNLSGIIDKLSKKDIEQTKNSLKCYRPWGSYEILKTSKNYQVKELIINPGSSISLQKHKKRSEHWVVVCGKATITKGKKIFNMKTNESIDIKIGEIHRLENKSKNILKIIEIQSGTYLGEDDIIRYKDEYSRI